MDKGSILSLDDDGNLIQTAGDGFSVAKMRIINGNDLHASVTIVGGG